MTPVLLFLGLAAVVVGVAMSSQATMGVGVVALGCFFGICARVVQAGSHQRKTEHLLEDLIRKASTAPVAAASAAPQKEDEGPVIVHGIVVRE